MRRKRHTPEEIVAKLRQVDVLGGRAGWTCWVDVLVAQGTPVAEAIRSRGVTEVGCGMNCWMGSSFTHCGRPGS